MLLIVDSDAYDDEKYVEYYGKQYTFINLLCGLMDLQKYIVKWMLEINDRT